MAALGPVYSAVAAPYGQACEACAKSRCKCMLRPGQQACERCHRLGKECRAINNKRKRQNGSPSTYASVGEDDGKTAQLERRLAELEASFRQQSGHIITKKDGMPFSSAETNDDRQDLWNAVRMTTAEAEARLETFKTMYLKWAPFVHFDPLITSATLYEQRPILWLSIMVTCAKEEAEIRRLDQLFRQTIADQMVLQCKKSIDLLLGLLVFISWYHHHCRDESGRVRPSLSLLIHMATSLVSDLKQSSSGSPQRIFNKQLQRHSNDPATAATTRSMEEKRAFLWCFLSSNIIYSYLQHDSLRWSGCLESCLEELAAKPEGPRDESLVQIVRMQLVLERANASRSMEENFHVPVTHYIQLLCEQLRQVWKFCPAHLKDSEVLRLHYHALELAIHEFGLVPRYQQQLSLRNTLDQHAARHACLASTRSWLDRYLQCPPGEFKATAFPTAIHSSCCLGMLFYLSTPEEPLWSPNDVQATDALGYVDRIIKQMEEAVRVLGLEQGDGVYATAQLYRSMRATWAARMGADSAAGAGPRPTTDMTNIEAFGDIFDFGLFENEWRFGWPMAGA